MDLLETGRRPPPVARPEPPHRLRGLVRWAVALVAAALFFSSLGWVIDDQVQARDQADRAQAALSSTRRTAGHVAQQLAKLRHDLEVLATQVGSDTTAYDQDAAELKAAQSELASTQVDVTHQTSMISALHTCLGGVEQALNALAVGNQASAISELSSVATSCSAASGG
jgi:chromosome segregation ATPase